MSSSSEPVSSDPLLPTPVPWQDEEAVTETPPLDEASLAEQEQHFEERMEEERHHKGLFRTPHPDHH